MDHRVENRIVSLLTRGSSNKYIWLAAGVLATVFAVANFFDIQNPFKDDGRVTSEKVGLQAEIHEMQDKALAETLKEREMRLNEVLGELNVAIMERQDLDVELHNLRSDKKFLTKQNIAIIEELRDRDLTAQEMRTLAVTAQVELDKERAKGLKSRSSVSSETTRKKVFEWIAIINKGCKERKREQDCSIKY